MSVPTIQPSWWDSVATAVSQPTLNWMNESVVPFVKMAEIEPGSTILDLGCGNAITALAAKALLGSGHSTIVGIDNSHGMLQAARALWEDYGAGDDITLLYGDVRRLDSLPLNPPVFDVIFARNIFQQLANDQQLAVLQSWTRYKKPVTGKIVMTYGLLDVAGCFLVDDGGNVHKRIHIMTDSDWDDGERAFRALVASAGLELTAVERVGFRDIDGALIAWTEMGNEVVQHAHIRWIAHEAAGTLEPEWIGTNGGPSPIFLKQLRQEMVYELDAQAGAEGPPGIKVVSFIAALAGTIV